MDNYEIARNKVQSEFYKEDHRAISEKRGLVYENDTLYIDFMDKNYRVNCTTGMVTWHKGAESGQADFNEVMTIFDIMCYSKADAHPSGEYTLLPSLSTVHNASSYAGSGMFKREELYFDRHTEELEEKLKTMGGIPWGKGDVSLKLPVFKGLDVVVSFWNSDEDFPPSLQFFCDKNTLQYMHYETAWYMVSHILKRLI